MVRNTSIKHHKEEIFNMKKIDKRIIISVIILFIILILLTRYKRLIVSILLIILGSLSMIYQRYFKISHYLGFELCMMATLLSAIKYGPHYGLFVGFFSITLAFIISGNLKHNSIISIITLPLVGAITPYIYTILPQNNLSNNLLIIGLIMTLVYDLIILPIYVLLGSRLWTTIIFFITHLLCNFWVFSYVAPIILNFM